MSKVKNFNKDKGYEIIPRELLQHPRLSLEAIGLLCNLQSYPEDWVLHKTELYKRFPKNKKHSVARMWKELEEEGYVITLKKRNGNRNEYVHYFNLEPFTEKDAKEIEKAENGEILSFRFSAPQNEHLKMSTSKSAPNRLQKKENTYQENTHEETTDKSIYLSKKKEELNKLDLPKKVAMVLNKPKNLDRLIEDSVSLLDIDLFYNSTANDLQDNDFCEVLDNTLSKTKGKINDIKALLTNNGHNYYMEHILPKQEEDREQGLYPS